MRLHIIVEGQTEEGFINSVLAPELGAGGIFIDAHSITTGRKHGHLHRGGLSRYGKLLRDLSLWMKQDRSADSWFSTMVDLYRLPIDFPGYTDSLKIPESRKRVEYLEGTFLQNVREYFNNDLISQRFLPHIQLHEFEALLFSDPVKFLDVFPDESDAVTQLVEIQAGHSTPEDIDDGEDTAPSKRILRLLPDYVKTVSGVLIAERIGLAAMRRECPHFDGWMANLQSCSRTI